MITTEVATLWPRWMESAGVMAQLRVLVRTRCCKCGAEMRVEAAEVAALHGAGACLIDRVERCRMVACDGSAAYLASRTYGQAWTLLLRDPELIATFASGPARDSLGCGRVP